MKSVTDSDNVNDVATTSGSTPKFGRTCNRRCRTFLTLDPGPTPLLIRVDVGTLPTPVIILYDEDGDYINGAYDLLSGRGGDARLHYYVDATTTSDFWVSAGGYREETGTYKLRVVAVGDDTEPDNVSTPGAIAVN